MNGLFGRFARNSFFSATAEGSIAIYFVLLMVSARFLGPGEFGVFTNTLALIGILEICNDLGLRFVFTRDVSRRRDLGRRYLGNILAMQLLLSVASFAVVWVVGSFLLATPRHRSLALVLQGASVLRSLKFLARFVFRTYDRFDLEAFLLAGERTAVLAVAALLFWRGHRSAEALAFAFVAVRAVDAVVTYAVLATRVVRPGLRWEFPLWGTLVAAAFPFALGHFVAMTLYKVGTLVLGLARPAEPAQVGYLQGAYQWIQGLGMFAVIFRNTLFPMISQTHGGADTDASAELYRRGLRYVLMISLPLAGLGMFVARDLILLLKSDFAPATIALQILLISVPFNFTSRVGTVAMAAMNRQTAVVILTAIAAAVALTGSVLTARAYGFVGVAVATTVAEGVFLVAVAWYLDRHGLRVQWPALVWRPAAAVAVAAGLLWAMRGSSIWIRLPVGGIAYLGVLTLIGFWDAEERALARSILRRGRPASD